MRFTMKLLTSETGLHDFMLLKPNKKNMLISYKYTLLLCFQPLDGSQLLTNEILLHVRKVFLDVKKYNKIKSFPGP